MMRRVFNVYGVYDEDKLVYEGTCDEIAEKYQVGQRSIYTYLHLQTKMLGRYDIKPMGYTKRKETHPELVETVKPKPVEVDLQKDHLAYLVHHLRLCGNTSCSSFDPRVYLDQLKDIGIECTVKEVPEVTLTTETKRGRKPKPKVHYYVEVV